MMSEEVEAGLAFAGVAGDARTSERVSMTRMKMKKRGLGDIVASIVAIEEKRWEDVGWCHGSREVRKIDVGNAASHSSKKAWDIFMEEASRIQWCGFRRVACKDVGDAICSCEPVKENRPAYKIGAR